MLKVGITGQNGFIGQHLWNTLSTDPESFELVPFERSFFEEPSKLEAFVAECDAIVHLAAKNRHNDPEVIYRTNVELVSSLIRALENTRSRPHLLFSSSTQEERDNPYGKSKREGREMLARWAEKNRAGFSGLVIPNVYGPFGHPYYNSVVATFCHQLIQGEPPQIQVDGTLNLIYVGELVGFMRDRLAGTEAATVETLHVPSTHTIKVSDILRLLEGFKAAYLEKGEIPDLANDFEVNLFNTFRSFIPHASYFPRKFQQHSDSRGSFVELVRLGTGGQVSFSTTVPGITRGNHFHTRKIERFAVIKGKALIQLRKIGTDEVLDFHLDGREPAYVDMPIWYTHNIKNTGDEELYTVFWINEQYDPENPDTYYESV